MSQEHPIIIEKLTKKFSNFVAVDNLNLKIKQNTCVGYLGPNGSGKTTTIKILTGLLRPSNGTSSILGFDVTQNKPAALQNVGVVMENPIFPGNLTPDEILMFVGKLRGMQKNEILQNANRVLEIVKLYDWHEKKIKNFSKGMKQRVAIAAAILHDPDILILDEPMSGLDPGGIIEIREIIQALKDDKKTIFLSSHLLGEIQEICDEVILLEKGKLLKQVSVNEIADPNKINLQIDFLSAPTKPQIEEIEKFAGVSENKAKDSSISIRFEGGLEQRAKFHKMLHDLGMKIISFKAKEDDLESLYMDNISGANKHDKV